MEKFKILFLFFCVVLLCGCNSVKKTDGDTSYATVNGEIITLDELNYYKSRDKSDIVNYFAKKYNITDFSSFWASEYESESPEKVLLETALDDCVKAKIKLIMMKQYGVYDDISFNGLKKLAEEYNEKNAENKSAVGLYEIDLKTFYTYYIDTGEMTLKNTLAEYDLKPTQDEIDSYMSENDGITEAGAVSAIVSNEYEILIDNQIENAVIEILQ